MTGAKTTVACVIPTHRRPQLLEEALRSVFAQTRPPDEVLVIDDECSQETRRRIAAVARGVPLQVRYLTHTLGRGPSTSRNLGAKEATAEWLAFLDDDDRWLPGYLEAALANQGSDLVLSGRWDFDDSGARGPGKVPLPDYDEADWLRRNLGGSGSSTLIRRSTFLGVGGYDVAMRGSEDRDLIIRAMRAGARYAALSDRLVEHRDEGPRLTKNPIAILQGRLRFLWKHHHAMRVGDVVYMLRKIVRELRRARILRGGARGHR